MGVYRNFETSEGVLEVLRGVNVTLYQGDMMAVVGESGVGKSTLLHILGGLDRPTQGNVRVKGELLQNMSEATLAAFRNNHVGFVFQHHYLMEEFTALENIMIPALIAGKSKKEAEIMAEQLLLEVGLANRSKHRPRQLSGGEQQRVAVARALINKPEIVLADEPSGNLDIKTGEKLHQLLAGLNESHEVTFLIATHNKELAESCHRIVKMEDGLLHEVSKN
ncbi:MAG: ABC transporter ATP-binding protein [candidate division Zixibacteria bacterium]|nr:ABC transporter ATP-binding protein [candidate division Zixibacteria bacterium]